MNKRCLIKFSRDDKTDLMHYVVYDGDVVVLSKKESTKIPYAKEKGELEVSFDIDAKTYDVLKVDLVEDLDYVKKVYDYMIETNNAYFTDGYEDLVAMKLRK
jgi:hypothetical protein